MSSDISSAGTAGNHIFGIPRKLIWGYVAVAVFMVGDGMEVAFIADYITQLGFSGASAAHAITVYGIGIAISSWLAGVLAEVWGPRRTMSLGVVTWVFFHVLFLIFGIMMENYYLIVALYGLRGLGYPLFTYGFVVWISYTAPKETLGRAMGWFWFSYSVGFLALGNYLPSYIIPEIGYLGVLWLEIGLIILGGLIGVFMVKGDNERIQSSSDDSTSISGAIRGVTIAYKRPQVGIAGIVRIINQIALYGFPVMLPILVTSNQVGFTISQWLMIWGTMGLTNVIFNAVWGAIGDRIGWVWQVRWFGCVGTAITSLLLYYVPVIFGAQFWLVIGIAILFGITMAAFVPMSAIIPSLAPDEKGIAMSIHNLAAGLSNFAGPAIVGGVLLVADYEAVVWVFAVVYIVGAALTLMIEGVQDRQTSQSAAPTD